MARTSAFTPTDVPATPPPEGVAGWDDHGWQVPEPSIDVGLTRTSFHGSDLTISPTGHVCGDMPDTTWIEGFIEDHWHPMNASWSLYDGDYVLDHWAGSEDVDSSKLEAAIELLFSSATNAALEVLNDQLQGFTPSPLVDWLRSASRKAFRRYYVKAVQGADLASSRSSRNEADKARLGGFSSFFGTVTDPESDEDYEYEWRVEHSDDAPYNPIIAVHDGTNPLAQVLSGSGVAGVGLQMLDPEMEPSSFVWPLNWGVANRLDFRAWWDGLGRLEQQNLQSLGDWFEVDFDSDIPVNIVALPESAREALRSAADAFRAAADDFDALEEGTLEDTLEFLWGAFKKAVAIAVPFGVLGGPWVGVAAGLGSFIGSVLTAAEVADMFSGAVQTVGYTLDVLANHLDAAASSKIGANEAFSILLAGFVTFPTQYLGSYLVEEEILSQDAFDRMRTIEESIFFGFTGNDPDKVREQAQSLWLSLSLYWDAPSGRIDQYWEGEWVIHQGTDHAETLFASGLPELTGAMTPVFHIHEYESSFYFNGYGRWDEEKLDGYVRSSHRWLKQISPTIQFTDVLDLSAKLLELGLHAESVIFGLSDLASRHATAGLLVRPQLAALGLDVLDEVLPGMSIARFVALLWRQVVADNYLAHAEADGYDVECLYEVFCWMDTAKKRELLDLVLGPVDLNPYYSQQTTTYFRRYEDGLIWSLFGTHATLKKLSESWADLQLPSEDGEEQEEAAICTAQGKWQEFVALLDGCSFPEVLSDIRAEEEEDEEENETPTGDPGEIPRLDPYAKLRELWYGDSDDGSESDPSEKTGGVPIGQWLPPL